MIAAVIGVFEEEMNLNGVYRLDPRNMEIKTKSIEQTLIPLVTQVYILPTVFCLLDMVLWLDIACFVDNHTSQLQRQIQLEKS